MFSFTNEVLLEPVVRYYRFYEGLSCIKNKLKPSVFVDIGCGPNIRLFHELRKKGYTVKRYYGVDPLLEKNTILTSKQYTNITLVHSALKRNIDVKTSTSDVTFAFAFLEHIDYPKEILHEMIRITKPGGYVVVTTPTWNAKTVLEFLSYRLGIISKREIDEHKQYFDKKDLINLVKGVKGIQYRHKYFELGMNNLFVIHKQN